MHLRWLSILPAACAVAATVNDANLWGAYRANLYFGVRPRLPQSLMAGLMWFGTHDYQSISKTRHACDQGDGIRGYTWTEYDPRQGGVQVINDVPNNVKITTQFLQVPGGDHGGSWAVRVQGEPMNPDLPSRISPIFYFGLEGFGALEMDTEEDENGIKGDWILSGTTPDLGDFTIRVVDGPDNVYLTEGLHAHAFSERIGKTHFSGHKVPSGGIWQAKEIIMQALVQRAQEILSPYQDPAVGPPDPAFVLQLPDEVYFASNLYSVQKTFDGPFQFDVLYESASAKQKLTSSVLDQGIPALRDSFVKRFEEIFPFPSDYPIARKAEIEAFSRDITASLMGGVAYFYGTSIMDNKFHYEWDEDEDDSEDDDEFLGGAHLTEPKALLTATPSRSFFPRGFYWDEGFHLLPIGLWDNAFSLEILKSWIDLIDENGWVAREQILGEEARSKVPAEFLTQVPSFANPPTLAMAVTALISRLKAVSSGVSAQDLGMEQVPIGGASETAASEETLAYLRSIYGPLKRHYEWFRRTQRGQIKQYSRVARSRTEAYRWRGRSPTHVLTSGMDDYPRGPPHAGELHLDLISWMAFFTRTMKDIATFVGETDDAASYGDIERAILDNIEDLHWSEKDQMYCDLDVDDEDESYHECHKGYLSLFPLMLSLLPSDSPHVGAILDIVESPDHLWSPYGLRSLSKSHPEFGQGENYWRGPIWIPMNYLTLRSLYKKYMVEEGPYQGRAQKIYTELRKNIVDNVFKEYQRTGYVWEQYDALTGEGRRSHPFTGWTSLVTLILSEIYE
ncbi:glycoside hydrolase family 63 protein [Fistulina hepatica ATCC 64428]|nr:glycoside hydrolase family 63 protein [Fistulina hepatica ATCC 64428]